MKPEYMKLLKKSLLFVVGFLSVFAACKNDDGYYDPVIPEKGFEGDVYEYLKSKPGVYDSLLKVVDRLQLESTLRDSDITLFALSNSSFQLALTNLNNLRKLNDRPSEYLANIDGNQLDTMLTQYIMRGKYVSDSLSAQDGLPLYGVKYGYPMHASLVKTASSGYVDGGPTVIEYSDTKRSQFVRNWVSTNTGSINLQTKNGIVHVISPDHVFGFGDFVSRLTYVPPPPNLFKTIGGIGTVSRENSGGPNAVEASKYAFDGNPETKFLIGNMGTVWLQFELNEPAVANAYTITSANDFDERDPIDWTLSGSNDGENWTFLDSKAGEIFDQRFQLRVFRISNKVAYKYYRLNIIRAKSGGTMQMADWSVNREEAETVAK